MEWWDVSTLAKGSQDPARQTCISISPKVGSSSMRAALDKTTATQITPAQALEYNFRVIWVRNSIKRFESFFNFVSNNCHHQAFCAEFLPRGTILAEGYQIEGVPQRNQHLKTQKMIDEYGVRKALEEAKGSQPSKIALDFHEADWRRYVDYVLAGNENDHWTPQVEQATLNGVFIPNIAHKFEDVDESWGTYVKGSTLEHQNTSVAVPHSDYGHSRIATRYAADLSLWGEIDGTWYAN